MSTLADIIEVATNAINQALHHYFENLASGAEKIEESKFLAEVLIEMQGWLVFTEESLQNIQDMIYKDTLYINLIYTLTALFRTRFVLPQEDYDTLVEHLAKSFDTKKSIDPKQSFMPTVYVNRIPDPDVVMNILSNNQHLVMLAVFYTYGSTQVLLEAL